jgi:hypothetical protein
MITSNLRWQVDDQNNTDLPIVTTDLVAAQSDYGLPTDLLRIQAVEVKTDGGDWVRLKPFDQRDVTKITDLYTSDGLPKFYDIRGNSIFLEPAPAAASVTLTAGLKLYISREGDDFASTDTTQEPGFPEPFHRICSLGGVFDYLVVRGPQETADRVRVELEQLRKELRDFFRQAVEEDVVTSRPAHRTSDYE